MAKTPGPYTISSDDEGGDMTNGLTHNVVMTIGDLDAWSIPSVAINDSIVVRLGDVASFPTRRSSDLRLRLISPDGSLLDDNTSNSNSNAAEVSAFRVTVPDGYTSLVSPRYYF